MEPEHPEYLVIGHVTRDLLPDGSFRAGGTAAYSALAAERLGFHVAVVTSADPTFSLFQAERTIDVHRRTARHTSTFENLYASGQRRQYIRAVAECLTLSDVPTAWQSASIVHLGPVAQEVDADLAEAFPHALLGVTPQGWLRRWGADGLVTPAEWGDAERVLSRADAVVLSLEDLGGDRERLDRYRRLVHILVLTVGRDGAIVYAAGRQERVRAYLVAESDPTGAGDLFATGYFIRLFEAGDVIEAARFANCVASFAVEGGGPASAPSREQVEERLLHGRLRG